MGKRESAKLETKREAREVIIAGLEHFQRLAGNGTLPNAHNYDAALLIGCALEDAGFEIVRKRANRSLAQSARVCERTAKASALEVLAGLPGVAYLADE